MPNTLSSGALKSTAGRAYHTRKACDSCHDSKVSCVPDQSLTVGRACKRCRSKGLSCLYTPVGPRRRPAITKKARIDQLEQRIRQLQMRVKGCPSEASVITSSKPPTPASSTASDSSQSTVLCRSSHAVSQDVVDRGILTDAQAEHLIRVLRVGIDGYLPGLCLARGLNSPELRRKRPALWLSALCVASSRGEHDFGLTEVLYNEMARTLQTRLMPMVEPSLELLQGLHNYMFFHWQPTSSLQRIVDEYLNFATHIILSVTRESELSKKSHFASWPDGGASAELMDISREVLIWYWVSFNLLFKRRHGTIRQYLGLVQQSISVIEKSEDLADRHLVARMKMVQLTHTTVLSLISGYTGHSGMDSSLRDQIVADFEEKLQLQAYYFPLDVTDETMIMEYNQCYLFISEILFAEGKWGIEDIRNRDMGLPPPNRRAHVPPHLSLVAPWRLVYTMKCVQAAQSILGIFTKAEPTRLRRFSIMSYARAFYALRFLLLLAHQIWSTGTQDIIPYESLQLAFYIDALSRSLRSVSGSIKNRVPELWLYALRTRIAPWYVQFCRYMADSAPGGSESSLDNYENIDYVLALEAWQCL